VGVDWIRRILGTAPAKPDRTRHRRASARRRSASVPSPVRFDLVELAARSGLSAEVLLAATPTYRTVRVPKRSGGERTLRVPDDATKAIQRQLLHRVLNRVPVHAAAHGFEPGRSILTNAEPHAGRPLVIRMDIVDFFSSTGERRIRRLFRVLGWDAQTAALLTRLTTDAGSLPQGAPTSPRLANLVNVRLDARLAALANARTATYTRYADDLTFSFLAADHGAVADILAATKKIVGQEGYRLHLGRKLQIRRRHHRQMVTGLVVNEHVALPRARRRWLRAVEHHAYVGKPASLTRDQLAGWQALESMIYLRRMPPTA
jgi:RNA-directed DNA polymerase